MATEKYKPKRKWWQLWKARSSPVDHIDAGVEHLQELEVPAYQVLQWLNEIGNGLHDRYARTGNLADLQRAISGL